MKKTITTQCPFCGGKKLMVMHNRGWGSNSYRVVCTKQSCAASGPIRDTAEAAEQAWVKHAYYLRKSATLIDNTREINKLTKKVYKLMMQKEN